MSDWKLFTPYRLRGLVLKNRVVLPAMGTKMATEDGHVTDRLIAYLSARAKGGCGLIISEVCSVHVTARGPHFLAVYDESYVEGLTRMASAIHDGGAKACLQLWHGGCIGCYPEVVTPSPYQLPGYPAGRELTVEEIHDIVKGYGLAAARAVEAGFDCVELHMAHGYLPEEFFSPHFNHRTDAYGGSFENRARFVLETIDEIRAHIPEEMPLLMRVLAEEDVDGGFTHEDIVKLLRIARERGVDLLDVSRGVAASAAVVYEVPPVDIARGFNVEAGAARMKYEVAIPTAAVGRINDPAQAEEILQKGQADLVVIGRGQLADPEFCKKAEAGRLDEIVRCVGCDQGCYDGFVDPNMAHITCLRNPFCGYELDRVLTPAETPRRVLIAGGGCAGLEAALILKARGHIPVVCEAGDALGGQFVLAGMAPRKEEIRAAAQQMARQAEQAGVEIRKNTPVTPALLEAERPDAVILATGSEPIRLNVPGADGPNVCSSHDILSGRVEPRGCVGIVGGGLVGVETAQAVIEARCTVKIIEMKPQICSDLGMLRNIFTMSLLMGSGVPVYTDRTCQALEPDAVVVEHNGAIERIDGLDMIVVAVGSHSRDTSALEEACGRLGIPAWVVGDAKKARRAMDAIHEAAEAALRI